MKSTGLNMFMGVLAAILAACGAQKTETIEGDDQEQIGTTVSALVRCGLTCSSGEHPTSYQVTSTCPSTPMDALGNNSVNCEPNIYRFHQCRTTCPAGIDGFDPGYQTIGSPYFNSVCGPGALNAVECIHRPIGYGQMGRRGGGWADTCAGTTPMNVDSRRNYDKAQYGEFSCWYNTPNVICATQPTIEGYINVRQCYVRPDGSMVDYGCGCP